MNEWACLQQMLAQGPVCLVEVVATQGSAPRGRGAWMAVPSNASQSCVGTIGGGHLEWEAERQARLWLMQGMQGETCTLRMALGPSLGQCCGGVVELRLSALHAQALEATRARLQDPRLPVALFGAGHVGQALVRVLQPLPFSVFWVDSREEQFPPQSLPHVRCEHSDPVQHAVSDVPAGAMVLVMSFSHAEDLEILCACLRRQRALGDLPFIGLIGSSTKWAVFQKRLAERGFTPQEVAHITCPIGVAGVTGKEPEIIAVAVAAQLLQRRAAQLSPQARA